MKIFRLKYDRGATIIEFSLSILIFAIFVFGIVEFGRALFLINMANKAAQSAARLATVCDRFDYPFTTVKEKVKYLVESSGQISTKERDWLQITYKGDTCPPNSQSQPVKTTNSKLEPCWITVSISNLDFYLMIPLLHIKFTLPEYKVTQVREAMSSFQNPACSQ